MKKSRISWTSYTWNPVHGCSKVSEGCRHCYAERISLERGFTKKPWTEPNSTDNVLLKPHKLNEPDKIAQPSMIFVNSMSDLFHGMIPDRYIIRVCEVMSRNREHIFQILTKRPERARFFHWPPTDLFLKPGRWPSHVWLGTSAEDQRSANERIPHLTRSFAQVRFLSIEPMLDWIILEDIPEARQLDWIIVGGESEGASRRREMSHNWVHPIRDFCLEHKIPFFFKQSSAHRTEIGKALRHEDGTYWSWQQYPEDLRDPIQTSRHPHAHLEALSLDKARRLRRGLESKQA